jgi:hypothetical protein
LRHEALDGLAEQRLRRLYRLGATIAEEEASIDVKLVALRVAAEIVVIVEYQNAGGVAVDFAIEPRGRQAADAAAHHDQVDMLVDRQGGEVEGAALAADLMRDFKGSWMAAP